MILSFTAKCVHRLLAVMTFCFVIMFTPFSLLLLSCLMQIFLSINARLILKYCDVTCLNTAGQIFTGLYSL